MPLTEPWAEEPLTAMVFFTTGIGPVAPVPVTVIWMLATPAGTAARARAPLLAAAEPPHTSWACTAPGAAVPVTLAALLAPHPATASSNRPEKTLVIHFFMLPSPLPFLGART